MIEIGTGGNPGNQFCPLDELLNDEQARKAYLNKITSRGLEISALSCHNNPISLTNKKRIPRMIRYIKQSN